MLSRAFFWGCTRELKFILEDKTFENLCQDVYDYAIFYGNAGKSLFFLQFIPSDKNIKKYLDMVYGKTRIGRLLITGDAFTDWFENFEKKASDDGIKKMLRYLLYEHFDHIPDINKILEYIEEESLLKIFKSLYFQDSVIVAYNYNFNREFLKHLELESNDEILKALLEYKNEYAHDADEKKFIFSYYKDMVKEFNIPNEKLQNKNKRKCYLEHPAKVLKDICDRWKAGEYVLEEDLLISIRLFNNMKYEDFLFHLDYDDFLSKKYEQLFKSSGIKWEIFLEEYLKMNIRFHTPRSSFKIAEKIGRKLTDEELDELWERIIQHGY